MAETDRRDFIKQVVAGSAVLLVAPQIRAAQQVPSEQIFARNFRVVIRGMYGQVPGVVKIDPGRVTVGIQEASQGDQPEYAHGSHSYDQLTMTFMKGTGAAKLERWAARAIKRGGSGKSLRRDISIHMLAPDRKTVLRRINCYECLPVRANTAPLRRGSRAKAVTLRFTLNRIKVT